jgi:hypothetical protein
MPPSKKSAALVEGVEKTAAVLAGTDYAVQSEDFILYELSRLIEEDRASFDDAEFRNLIDEGIRAHIQESLELRARLSRTLRSSNLTGDARTVAMRVVHALEDVEADLCNVAVIVRNYTGYLFSRLESLEPEPSDEDRISTAADLLFESTGDRSAAETALEVLCGRITAVSARVLAHAVSEPLLDEDLEAKAWTALKSSWPLPRHYMLYSLREHPHEDIPIRWFQLFVEVDEPSTVELVLDELRAHGENPAYVEDLAALMETLHPCRDPELEDKILDAVNSPTTSKAVQPLLGKFLEEHRPAGGDAASPWSQRLQALERNRQYRRAAEMFEQGEKQKALELLGAILDGDPEYPFAVMLKKLIEREEGSFVID